MEGIRTPNKSKKVVIRRRDKVDTLVNLVDHHRTVLVRSTPATGKTSMLQLVEDELTARKRTFYSVDLNEMRKYTGTPTEVFDRFFSEKIPHWRERIVGAENVVVLMDETQKIYKDYADDFWELVKWLDSKTLDECGVRFLFFAAYGLTLRQGPLLELSTPFTPSMSLDASFLYCTTNETADLVAKFFTSTETTVGHPEQLPEILFRLTAGHIDMLLLLLKDLYNAFKYLAQEEQVDPRAFCNYLLSHRVGQSISRSRGAPNFDHLPEKSKSYLIHLLEQETGSRLEVADERESFRDLMQRYILRWDDTLGAVCFLSPAVERLAFFELYASPRARLDVSSLDDFIKRTLFAMRADFLRNNLGVSRTGVLLERVWQAEVYRAATSILPIGTFISHEVGHIFNTRGMVDFYVNDTKQWLIEITRGGDKLREHVDRLQGTYASIPRKEEVILDFRVGKKLKGATLRKFGAKVWFVIVDSSYEFATIHRLLPDNNKIHTERIDFTKPASASVIQILQEIDPKALAAALSTLGVKGTSKV